MIGRALACLAVGVVGGGLSLAGGEAIARLRGDGLVAAARQALADDAGAFAEALDIGMLERWRAVQELASADPTGSDEAAKSARRAGLNAVKGRAPDWAWIGVAGLDGTVTAATDGILEGRSVAERPWFVEGRSRPVVLDVHEARLLAAYLGGDPASPPRLLDIAAPLRGPQGVRGVLGAHLSWTWAKGVERAVRAERPGATGAQFLVLSGDQVLLGPAGATPAAAGGIAATAATHGRDEYPGLGWRVMARREEAAVRAPAETLAAAVRAGGFGLTALLAGGLLLAGWWPRRHVPARTRPAGRGA